MNRVRPRRPQPTALPVDLADAFQASRCPTVRAIQPAVEAAVTSSVIVHLRYPAGSTPRLVLIRPETIDRLRRCRGRPHAAPETPCSRDGGGSSDSGYAA